MVIREINWRSCQEINERVDNEFLDRIARKHQESLGRDLISLEIGSYQEATASILAQYGVVFAIDLWGDVFDGFSKYETIGQVNFIPFIQNMTRLKIIDRVFPIVSSSLVLEFLSPLSLDLIYIDASHYDEPVKLDIQRSVGHLRSAGLLAFHDYFEDPNRPHVGVKRAVDKLLGEGKFTIHEQFPNCMVLRNKDFNPEEGGVLKMSKFSDYRKLPFAIDMAPYDKFYKDITRKVIDKNIENKRPTIIVEAGTRTGVSARIFLTVLDDPEIAYNDWKLVLIDPIVSKEAAELPIADTRVTLRLKFAQECVPEFEDKSIDILHIDADFDATHPYELAHDIFLSYQSKLRPNATVIFHDCTPRFPGIVRLVKELENAGWETTYCTPEQECPISAPAACQRVEVVKIRKEKGNLLPMTKVRGFP